MRVSLFAMTLVAVGVVLARPAAAQDRSDPLDAQPELSTRAALPPALPPAAPVAPVAPAWTDIPVDLSGGPYWNTRARLVVVTKGKRTSRAIPSATTDRLVDALQRVRQEGGQVVEIELKGHGAPEVQTLGGGTFLIASGRNVLAHLKDGRDIDIAPLLNSTLAPTATVNLNGCQTARATSTVTEAFSHALPGRIVSGGSRFYQLGIPFTAKSLGTKKYFQDGKLKSRWWYWID